MDPRKLKKAEDPVGPDNDLYLREMIAGSGIQVCAWGNHGNFMGRADIVLKMVPDPYCLGLTKEGQPKHPLYVPYSQPFMKFSGEINHARS